MMEKRVAIPVAEVPEKENSTVSGILAGPEAFDPDAGAGLVFAHGAANDMHNPIIKVMAERLAEAGHPTLRFNFLYRENGKDRPDSLGTLVNTWKSVHRYFTEQSGYSIRRFIPVGKSMGGRIASLMVADGSLPADGMIFLGYPLHPPGKTEKMKPEHLYRIQVPKLYFAGTRDPFARIDLLTGVVEKQENAVLEVIDGGDHSLDVPASGEVSQEAVFDRVFGRILEWLGILG